MYTVFDRNVALAFLSIILILVSCDTLVSTSKVLPSSPSSWQMTWHDEFDGAQINASNWQVWDNHTHGPTEKQLYLKDEAYVQNGNLVLRTQHRQAWYGSKMYNFTSGWVLSEHLFSQQFGKFEIRAKLPDWKCAGIWPAHWLMPEPETSHPPNVCWPVGGEIDIMEMVGTSKDCNMCGTMHWAKQCDKDLYRGHNGHYPPVNSSIPPIDWAADYHIFDVEWDTDSIVWAVDGKQYHWRSHANATIPQDPFYVILNTAISPWQYNNATAACMPQYHYIDYVRVYERVSSDKMTKTK